MLKSDKNLSNMISSNIIIDMNYDWIDGHASKYAQTLSGKIYAGVSCNTESIRRSSRMEEGMAITIVISGSGNITANGKEYEIRPSTVLFRHPMMDYSLILSSQCFHRRCYLVLPREIFALLLDVHPNLINVPPVFDIDDPRKYLDDFLMIFERIRESGDEDLFSLLPVIERYILHLLSPYLINGKSYTLRRAKARLEVDFSSTLQEIAAEYSMSYNTFRKNFTSEYGISPQQYRLKNKIENAKQLLSMGHRCSEVADMLGYPDSYTFSHQFKQIEGTTPKEYRKGHIL